jgi:chlorophyllide a reductase subunit Y
MQAKVLYMTGNDPDKRGDSRAEVVYDDTGAAPLANDASAIDHPAATTVAAGPEASRTPSSKQGAAAPDTEQAQVAGDGVGCHAGAAELRRAAEAAGQSELLQALCRRLSHRST